MNHHAIILFFSFVCSTKAHFNVNFDTSMGMGHRTYDHYYQKSLEFPQAISLLTFFQSIYEKNKLSKIHRHISPKIPKIIHQIWLGSPLPEKFKKYTQTWSSIHPDWQYILWTDSDIEKLKLENLYAYKKAINYAERSDIARYEILYRWGGLYVDVDCQCMQSFDILHHCYDFYCGLELPCMATFLQPIIIPNALIGSMPGHAILKACIDKIKFQAPQTTQTDDIVVKTGPVLFTQAVIEHIDKSQTIDIVLPCSFLFPIDKETKDLKEIEQLIQQETFAIHHWAGSWILRQDAFVPGIKIRCKQEGNILKFSIIDERQLQ